MIGTATLQAELGKLVKTEGREVVALKKKLEHAEVAETEAKELKTMHQKDTALLKSRDMAMRDKNRQLAKKDVQLRSAEDREEADAQVLEKIKPKAKEMKEKLEDLEVSHGKYESIQTCIE